MYIELMTVRILTLRYIWVTGNAGLYSNVLKLYMQYINIHKKTVFVSNKISANKKQGIMYVFRKYVFIWCNLSV